MTLPIHESPKGKRQTPAVIIGAARESLLWVDVPPGDAARHPGGVVGPLGGRFAKPQRETLPPGPG